MPRGGTLTITDAGIAFRSLLGGIFERGVWVPLGSVAPDTVRKSGFLYNSGFAFDTVDGAHFVFAAASEGHAALRSALKDFAAAGPPPRS